MDAREMESLSKRLIQNPHDQEALLAAHQAGQADPAAYAMFLEKVGNGTTDPAFACHWLTEAANVWLASIGDAPRAARVLMKAIERDPTQPSAGDRLAELYRERGDTKALVALLERRCKAIDGLPTLDATLTTQAAAMREELGRLWSEAPLSNTRKATEHFRRAIELDSTSQYAIYALRELLKAEQAWAAAVPYFELEQRLVDDPERRLALYQDEASVRQQAGDRAGASEALRRAREIEGGNDPSLKQQLATLTLERVQAQEDVPEAERNEAAQLFVALAEEYPGEHGLSYSLCALETSKGDDRAVQLAMFYAEELGREAQIVQQVAQYLKANPSGALTAPAREYVNKLAQAGLADESVLDALAPTDDAPKTEKIQALLDQANALARRARKPEAAEKYQQILELDPSNEEAVQFMESYLRQRRKYPELRELFRAAAAIEDAPFDARMQWLRELAGLCETQLRDAEGAISAWQSVLALSPTDEGSLEQLQRLLERAGRWDELVVLLEEQAGKEDDIERRVAMERSIAKIHEQKRKDPIATGHTWSRIANLLTDDDAAILSAVKSFERGERIDLAAQCLADSVGGIEDETARAHLYQKLGSLRETLRDFGGAGDAYLESAATLRAVPLFEAAEKCFVEANAWAQAASVVDELVEQTGSAVEKAKLYATAAVYLTRAGDPDAALSRLEQATAIDPGNDTYAEDLERMYGATERHEDIVRLLLNRAEQMRDRDGRVALRKRAAGLQRNVLKDPEGARESLLLVLSDGDDADALRELVADAEERQDFQEATSYLHRLATLSRDPAEKVQYLLREAELLAEKLDEPEASIARYEGILTDLDPGHAGSLEAIAALYERLDNPKGTARALERLLKLELGTDAKLTIARKLADLYETRLDDPKRAILMLDTVRELDEEDFSALGRLVQLAESTEDWERLARHLAEQLGIEGDEDELSRMARQLAALQHEKLGKDDEALSVLMHVADLGDAACREEYIALADELGWKGIVATKLVEWNLDSPNGSQRNEALRGAFERFLAVGRNAEAAGVGRELVRAKAADTELTTQLEELAVELKDLDTLEIAQDLLAQSLSGPARAEEMVRQAEIRLRAGVDVPDAIQHGEQALTSVAPDQVEPLLQRLGKLTDDADQRIDLYERQVTRCKLPADRLRALSRAAQVAAELDSLERSRTFFDITLGGNVPVETMELLETLAAETDERLGRVSLRRVLAESFASGGQGSKDGGRTRAALLRRAAMLAYREFADKSQAFQWLADSIVAHVEDEGLDELERFAREVDDVKRAEAVLTRALEEVFDGPLVRRLLARRANLRRHALADPHGAAADLKRLHDLSPSDHAVTDELSQLYQELGDYRGMVQLFEDQILRGKDPTLRADLARRVARLWEEELGDAREAADAWRRVLRLKQGDPEATEGLERAKSNMLRHRHSVVGEETRPQAHAVSPAMAPSDGTTNASKAEAAVTATPIHHAVKFDDATVPDLAVSHFDSDDAEDRNPGSAPGSDQEPGNDEQPLAVADETSQPEQALEAPSVVAPASAPFSEVPIAPPLASEVQLSASFSAQARAAEPEPAEPESVKPASVKAPLLSAEFQSVALSELEPSRHTTPIDADAVSVRLSEIERSRGTEESSAAARGESEDVSAPASKLEPSRVGPEVVSVALSELEPSGVKRETPAAPPGRTPPPPPPRLPGAAPLGGLSRPPPPLPPRGGVPGRPPPPPPSLRPPPPPTGRPPAPPPPRPIPPPHPTATARAVEPAELVSALSIDDDLEDGLDVDDTELIEDDEPSSRS
jgi:tetratricopeptide (TPR) repeat protein